MLNSPDDFDFILPESLIAQYPLPDRSASRLMRLDTRASNLNHGVFTDLLDWARAGDLMVFNDTKVMPARLWGQKASGGQIECLIERILSEHEALAHIRASKSPPIGSRIQLADDWALDVLGRQQDLYHLHSHHSLPLIDLLQKYGSIPLPPYIDRSPDDFDQTRYQTVYARELGAVAAPTAGLHFNEALLTALKNKGVKLAYVTLHIGAGTFQPVRVASLDQHQMHHEYMDISESVCAACLACREKGGRVIAVGTTVARSLETAARDGVISPYHGETNLFIRPGFEFKGIDALLTNFHLPKSTLLMLVTALGGYEFVMNAYRIAVAEQYRFFSYGDAMLLDTRKENTY